MSIYLDNAATTYPKPECVYEAVNSFMRFNGSSAGRGNYRKALESEEIVHRARAAITKLIGANHPSRIIFTSNTTEGLNLALKGILKPRDHVITTNIEHNSVWRPLKKLEQEQGITISEVNCAADGSFNLAQLESEINKNTKLICIIHASNVLGNILPVDSITRVAKSYGIPVLLDAAQTTGVYPIDVMKDGIDLLAFAGHKGLLGPMGTGGLYIREGLELNTLKEGGTGSKSSQVFQPQDLPDRFEVGTMNIVGLAGLQAAVEYIEKIGVEAIRSKEEVLTAELLKVLSSIPEIDIFGSSIATERVGLVTFNIKELPPVDVAYVLDEVYGIMVRAGLHCSPKAHALLKTEKTGAIRASVSYFTEITEIHTLGDALKEIIEKSNNIKWV